MCKKELVAGVCFLAAVLIFITGFSRAAIPKRYSYGANWGPFLKEEKHSIDVMFFGSSIVYCDIMPSVIEEETGLAAYVLAGPEQTIPTTYYYIREAFRTQSPSLVFVELTGMFYPRYTDFTKANIGYMPWFVNRFAAAFQTAEREEWTGLIFPMYNYHDRWSDLGFKDFLEGYSTDENRGYTFLDNTEKMEGVTIRKVNFDNQLYGEYISYLNKIAQFCVENGSKPIFFLAPSCGRWEEIYLDKLKKDVTNINDAVFYDFNDNIDELGIDYNTDFFDFLHFNNKGAEKFSVYLSKFIAGQEQE